MDRDEMIAVLSKYNDAPDGWTERVHSVVESELGLDALTDEALAVMIREYRRMDQAATVGGGHA